MDEICQDDQWFEQAFTYMNNNDIPLPNDKKLHFYGLFKQATIGDCDKPKPGLIEFVGRAKWEAWNKFKGMGFRDARNAYIDGVEALNVGWSRKGSYEYIPSEEEVKEANGIGVAVSAMAYDSGDEEDTHDIFSYARENNQEALSKLLEHDKSLINSKDDEGLSALHYAADRGNVGCVELLIQHGADVNIKTDEEETALHLGKLHYTYIYTSF
ncbi:ACBP-domain-containing protein [Backusella circina FSU 941]|nr:ACBP-domain-containing protein [Backusella circina FSU 941]